MRPAAGVLRNLNVKQTIKRVMESPDAHRDDPHFGPFAQAVLDAGTPAPFGSRFRIAPGATAGSTRSRTFKCGRPAPCRWRSARRLMPDAHVGYGLPIGGVLALENAVVPYAVGVDIACRMKLSVLDLPAWQLTDRLKFDLFERAIEKGTRFGVGSRPRKAARASGHGPGLVRSRASPARTRTRPGSSWALPARAITLSSSAMLTLAAADAELGSGRRASTWPCSAIAAAVEPARRSVQPTAPSRAPSCRRSYESLGRLAWLDLDSEAGQEYWAAMNLMGEYAAANHDVIHRLVSKLLGAKIIAGVENHHNFAWKEVHGGREVIVHRKGATPAGQGVLGVIPGSMADPAFVVRGKGCAESLNSASHGAGRRMSRTQAKQKFTWNAVKKNLEKQGVHVLSAGADEVPGVYKNIEDVMREQQDLVEIVARFDPKIVKMCGDGSAAED